MDKDPGKLVTNWYKLDALYKKLEEKLAAMADEMNTLRTELADEFGIQVAAKGATAIEVLEYIPPVATEQRPIVSYTGQTTAIVDQIRAEAYVEESGDQFNSWIGNSLETVTGALL